MSTVMIIDDEPETLDWLSYFLTDNGHSCIFAKNVAAAIPYLPQKDNIQLALVDLKLPKGKLDKNLIARYGDFHPFNGLYVASLFRDKGWRANQLMLYSGYNVDSADTRALELGLNYYIKGDDEEIIAEVKRRLGIKSK